MKAIFKKTACIIEIILMLLCITAIAEPHGSVQPIPIFIQQKMQKYSWHPGCPVALSGLAYVQVPYWGFDHQAHMGVLIVNHRVAYEVLDIFTELFAAKFPIEKIIPMYLYQGDDFKSTADNNTSAFDCRKMIGDSGRYSVHSYGLAIDINPLLNPYVNGNKVLPPQAKKYLYRSGSAPGMIVEGDIVYRAFSDHGWVWGGLWHNPRDYQHFEKMY